MSVHFLALDLKEMEIAETARQKAEEISSTELAEMTMSWLGGSSSAAYILSDSKTLFHPLTRQLASADSDEDMKQAMLVGSSHSFESITSSNYSASPLAEQAIPFQSADHSATPSNSELEDCSDNEGTQAT